MTALSFLFACIVKQELPMENSFAVVHVFSNKRIGWMIVIIIKVILISMPSSVNQMIALSCLLVMPKTIYLASSEKTVNFILSTNIKKEETISRISACSFRHESLP